MCIAHIDRADISVDSDTNRWTGTIPSTVPAELFAGTVFRSTSKLPSLCGPTKALHFSGEEDPIGDFLSHTEFEALQRGADGFRCTTSKVTGDRPDSPLVVRDAESQVLRRLVERSYTEAINLGIGSKRFGVGVVESVGCPPNARREHDSER